ncbi:GAK system XXXCH domain-containing protein [Fundidesulfovibrio soli]|uniref:GAK system XXXCH domain-containing protein n=1 Tax=Fundidesulfovibrio soli TaxID=2922716 RepID=UPI001FAFA0F5|nr:GAK system XXXCH domain-containing protein [Fundidesulfovibrio soli]
MSMTGKHKVEFAIPENGLADWLRTLADQIEAGALGAGEAPVSLEGYRGLKIAVKPSVEGELRAKLSIKFPKPARSAAELLEPGILEPGIIEGEEDEEEGEMPKYKSLKKHMKSTFKAIGTALAAGQTPPAAEFASFIADSKLMVAYPGKGDEFYPEYLEKTQALEAAFAAGDLEAMKAMHQELARLKRECHSRHA